MTTSEATTSQTAVLRVLLNADGALTSGEVAMRSGVHIARAFGALNWLREHPRVSYAADGNSTLWWLA